MAKKDEKQLDLEGIKASLKAAQDAAVKPVSDALSDVAKQIATLETEQVRLQAIMADLTGEAAPKKKAKGTKTPSAEVDAGAEKILAAVNKAGHDGLSFGEIVDKSGLGVDIARSALAKLKRTNKVKGTGKGKAGRTVKA